MKRNIAFILILLISAFISISCVANKLTGSLQEEDFIIYLPGNIKFNLGEIFTDSLKDKLGTPINIDEYCDDDPIRVYYYNQYHIITFVYDKEISNMIVITGKGIKTTRNLAVGDDKGKIIETYGQGEIEEETDKEVTYKYSFENELANGSLQSRYIYITWSITTKKVTKIVFVSL